MNKWVTYVLAAVAVGFVAAYLLIASFRDAVNSLAGASGVAVHPTTGAVNIGISQPDQVMVTAPPVAGSTPIPAPGGTLTSSATVNGGITATTSLVASPQLTPPTAIINGPLGPQVATPDPNVVVATQTFSTPIIQPGVTTGQPASLTSAQLLTIAQAANAAINALIAAGTISAGSGVNGTAIRDANGNITGYSYTTTAAPLQPVNPPAGTVIGGGSIPANLTQSGQAWVFNYVADGNGGQTTVTVSGAP